MKSSPLLIRCLAYVVLAVWSTWPALLRFGQVVPGAARTDIWNSLWSLWFFQHQLRFHGGSFSTELLSSPRGGMLVVADPLNAILAAPFIPLLGVDVTYTLLVFAQLTAAGLIAHTLTAEIAPDKPLAGWIAGVGYATAPVLLSGVHNGTSESFSGAWTALAIWLSWRAARHGGTARVVLAVFGVFVGALASWYSAVVVFLFLGALVIAAPSETWRAQLGARLAVLVLGLVTVAPMAAAFAWASDHPQSLVAIKTPHEMMAIRRSTGPADVLGYFAMGDFRSPDFRVLSRYGEAFFHCHYLGYVLLIGALASLWQAKSRTRAFLWIAAALGFVLSLGPVLIRDGMALIIFGDRVIPMPYFLIERLPGFSSLTLLFRLALAPALALAVLAGIGLGGRRGAWVIPWLILIEGRMLCPLGGLPDVVDVTLSETFTALREAPAGAVMNYPVVGGRGYLYEQTVHQKPVTDSLNFPNNRASRRVWEALLKNRRAPVERMKAAVAGVARREGVRYLVVHDDEEARPDMHDPAARLVEEHYAPLDGAGRVRVYPLW